MEIRECPSIDNRIPRVLKHECYMMGPPITAVGEQLEGQWDRVVLSKIAGERLMGKSEGSDRLSMGVL